MNILFVVNGFPPTAFGGVEVYTHEITRVLANRGHQVTVFCRESDQSRDDFTVLKDQTNHVNVFRVINDHKVLRSFSDTYRSPQIEGFFSEVINQVTPDIVHFQHLIALSEHLPLISQQKAIPSVITLHDYWSICPRVNLVDWKQRNCNGPMNQADCALCMRSGETGFRVGVKKILKHILPWSWRQKIRKIILKRSSSSLLEPLTHGDIIKRYRQFKQAILSACRVFTPSLFVRGMYVLNGYPDKKIEVLQLGIKLHQSKANILHKRAKGEMINFAFVGTILPIKGLHILINAFHHLENSNVRLNIYGRQDVASVSYINDLRKIADSDRRIIFKGIFSSEGKEDVYRETDVVVIPSIAPETFSLVAREALVMGIPVIASNRGALPEIIYEGVNGFLVQPGDEEALYQVIKKIADDPGLLNLFNCPGPVDIISVEEHVQILEDIYSQVISTSK